MPSSSESKDPRRGMKIKAILSFETSISIYQSTRRDSPEDLNFHHLRGNIKSRSTIVVRSPTKEMMNMTTCYKRQCAVRLDSHLNFKHVMYQHPTILTSFKFRGHFNSLGL
jgi:hypothetical protein